MGKKQIEDTRSEYDKQMRPRDGDAGLCRKCGNMMKWVPRIGSRFRHDAEPRCLFCHNRRRNEFHKTPEGKAHMAAANEAARLYRKTPEGKEAERLYRQRPKVKEATRLYRQSPKVKAYMKVYKNTPEGAASQRKSDAKRIAKRTHRRKIKYLESFMKENQGATVKELNDFYNTIDLGGFKEKLPATLYYLYSKSLNQYQIGITNDFQQRLRTHNFNDGDWIVIDKQEYDTGKKALDMERKLKKLIKEARADKPDIIREDGSRAMENWYRNELPIVNTIYELII